MLGDESDRLGDRRSLDMALTVKTRSEYTFTLYRFADFRIYVVDAGRIKQAAFKKLPFLVNIQTGICR